MIRPDSRSTSGWPVDAGIKYGTKALVITDSPEILEGEWHGPRTVVLEV
jgi:uncharacterized protein (DUF1330 family)